MSQIIIRHYDALNSFVNERVTMKTGYDYGNTEVVSYSDYYPFGQQMPARNGGESYRFTGINGQEVEKEITTNTNSHSSAEYWMMLFRKVVFASTIK